MPVRRCARPCSRPARAARRWRWPFTAAAEAGDLRLHVRIDERSAAFLALGLAKASGRRSPSSARRGPPRRTSTRPSSRPTSPRVPLLVLTADRPPGAARHRRQPDHRPAPAVRARRSAGSARSACPRTGPAQAGTGGRSPAGRGRWRSGSAAGAGAGAPERGVPRTAGPDGPAGRRGCRHGSAGAGRRAGLAGAGPAARRGPGSTPAAPGPWTCPGPSAASSSAATAATTRRRWPSWPRRPAGRCSPSRRRTPGRAPPRCRPTSTCSTTPAFLAAHRPDVIVSAGRPGLSRGQLAFCAARCQAGRGRPAGTWCSAQGPGRWADPARSATDVAGAIRLTGAAGPGCTTGVTPAGVHRRAGTGRAGTGRTPGRPLAGPWRAADAAASAAVDCSSASRAR